MYSGSPNPPPRINLVPSWASFQHHSFTLPAMSVVPNPLKAVELPTGWVPSPWKLLPGATNGVVNADSDASVQWYAVGRLLPTNSAYAAASYQFTPATGYFSRPFGNAPISQVAGPGRPVTS